MNKTPRVTVAVATYNRAHLLDGLIENILNQTFSDFEIVIVNDGSTDETAVVLEQYTDHDRIRIHHHDENQGVGAAKDTAASLAKGQYVAFLDDDDRWHPTKLEKQISRFESLSDEYAVVQTKMENIQDGETVDISQISQTEWIYPEILVKCMISFSTVMIRRECLEVVGGFDPSFPRVVDWDLWIRVAKHYKFAGIDDILTRRYRQDDSITTDLTHGVEGRQLIWEKYQEDFQKHPKCADEFKAIWEPKKGFHQLRQGNRRRALRHFWNLLRMEGVSMRNLGWFMLAISGRPGYNLAESLISGLNKLSKEATNRIWFDI